MLVVFCLVFSLTMHGFFVLDCFTEPDAVKLAEQGLGWHREGSLAGNSYRAKTSLFYLIVLKTALEAGLPPVVLPVFMN